MNKIIYMAIERCVKKLATIGQVDLRCISNQRLGILQWHNARVSGEQKFIDKIVPDLLLNLEPKTFFDIGANEGDYSLMILGRFPNCRLHCFEPNPPTVARLSRNLEKNSNVVINQEAVGERVGELTLFDYAEKLGSSHASLHSAVLTEQHRARKVKSVPVSVIDLDTYCEKKGISEISLLKIDVEGYELSVLIGAKRMIFESQIKVIQFEFNEMNVISRTFLRDFYELLVEFSLFRLRSDGLIPLGSYRTRNDVFKYQK